jgi:PII-like signaling protein
VDSQDNIERVLPQLDDLVREGLMTMEKVRVLHYAPTGDG